MPLVEGGFLFDDRALDIEWIAKLLLVIEDHPKAFVIKNEIEKHFTIEQVQIFFREQFKFKYFFRCINGFNFTSKTLMVRIFYPYHQ